MYLITIIEMDTQIQFLAYFDRELRLIVFLQSTVVVDKRPCWFYHQLWRQIVKWIRQACQECLLILGGIDTKFGYLALHDPKL